MRSAPLVAAPPRVAPLLLSSFAPSVGIGETFLFSAADLRPRTIVPYWIDSIRMAVYATSGVPNGADMSWRGIAKWKFTLGRYVVTAGFVPMWNFCPVRQTATEQGGYFHWVLPRPILCTPTLHLAAEMLVDGNSPNALSAYVAYAGRKLDCDAQIPPEQDVPFVSCWDTSDPLQSTGFDSPNTVLFNSTRKNLQIQRIVGRVQSNNSGTITDGDDTTLVQIFHHTGVEVTGGPVQHSDLFPPQLRAMPFAGILPPNQSVHVRLGTQPNGSTYEPMFSIIGVRKEMVL